MSTATASRILSGARAGSPETAARVRTAARDLGYTGNSIARALRRRTTGNVGMVVPSIGNPFFTSLVEEVEHHLAGMGLNLFLCDARNDPELEAERLTSLTRGNVDGILISPVDSERSRAALEATAATVPVVQLDRFVRGSDGDRVILDDDHAIRLVVEHLADVGATTAAFVTSTAGSSSAHLRLAGVQRWGLQYGVSIAPDHVLDGEFTLLWGARAADRLLATGPLPDAVICSDDLLAVGMVMRLAQQGVHAPTDVLVSGFDDIDLASLTVPSITTLRQPRERMAAEAVRLLAARTADPSRAGSTVSLQGVLVARASTARRHDAAPAGPS
ncbi:transcriptional regulator, LacI family [Blastococcus haudaquaticus]|uniref:Transcriptional regulator, LacI family n=1 Tax=Blastococcus haudaquaticus TaxID=1938745 RepID=A0A286H182_9ACTN|nr:transcriptional regulator, LacI family [Blastococcus haudaquaticus]